MTNLTPLSKRRGVLPSTPKRNNTIYSRWAEWTGCPGVLRCWTWQTQYQTRICECMMLTRMVASVWPWMCLWFLLFAENAGRYGSRDVRRGLSGLCPLLRLHGRVSRTNLCEYVSLISLYHLPCCLSGLTFICTSTKLSARLYGMGKRQHKKW